MATIQTQIPDLLLQQAQYLVQQGWVASMDDLIAESMRRYLESHRESMTNASFVKMSIGESNPVPNREYRMSAALIRSLNSYLPPICRRRRRFLQRSARRLD